MLRIEQHEYEDLDDPVAHPSHPIVMHCGPAGKDRNAIILIHGLTGTRYQYWGNVPRYLFSDLPNTDIGLYYYRTAWRRFGLMKSIALEREATVLADELRSLKAYKSITLIGHSMGGLLAKAAICSLHERKFHYALRKISGLILVASPQLGSLRVPRLLKLLSRDGRALYPHGDLIRRIDQTFNSHLEVTRMADPRDKHSLPTFAVIAAEDFWVDPLSAGIGLPDNQKKTVRGTHGSILRPASKQDETYAYIRDCVDTTFKPARMADGTEEEWRCDPATHRDVQAIRRMAVSMFGEDVTAEVTLAEFIDSSQILGVVRRIIWTLEEFERRERLAGYWCLIPVSSDTARLIREGKLRGGQIGPAHVAKSNASTLYIGAVAAIDFYSRGFVLEALRGRLRSYALAGVDEVLTRPLTDDGWRLVKRYGLKPIDGTDQDVGCLCSASMKRLLARL